MLDLLTSGLSVVFAPKMFILIIFAVFLGTLHGQSFYGWWDITFTVSEDAETGQGDISRRHVYILVFQITGMQRLVEFDVVMRTILVTVTLVYD